MGCGSCRDDIENAKADARLRWRQFIRADTTINEIDRILDAHVASIGEAPSSPEAFMSVVQDLHEVLNKYFDWRKVSRETPIDTEGYEVKENQTNGVSAKSQSEGPVERVEQVERVPPKAEDTSQGAFASRREKAVRLGHHLQRHWPIRKRRG